MIYCKVSSFAEGVEYIFTYLHLLNNPAVSVTTKVAHMTHLHLVSNLAVGVVAKLLNDKYESVSIQMPPELHYQSIGAMRKKKYCCSYDRYLGFAS